MNTRTWHGAALTTLGVCVAITLAAAIRSGALPVSWWGPAPIGAAAAGLTGLVSAAHQSGLGTHAYRTLAWLIGGTWVTWAAHWRFTVWMIVVAGAGVLLLVGLRKITQPAVVMAQTTAGPTAITGPVESQQDRERRLAARLIAELLGKPDIAKRPGFVTTIEPWPDPTAGVRLCLNLAAARGQVKRADIVNICHGIAVALDLPEGCIPEVVRETSQGRTIVDIPLRATAATETDVDDMTPCSVYDEMTVMHDVRGEPLNICFRERSAVVGGAPGWGKTTLLHRMALHFQRCTDVVTCIVDTTGGNLAVALMTPYALGLTEHPPLGWVAATEGEALAMGCVVNAIIRDRRGAPEVIRRKRSGDNMVLPVDASLPLIMLMTDEGGELTQAKTLVGQYANNYISRLAQTGRAEGGRVIMSILRGTSDLLEKGLRTMAAIRITLRMEEEDEYGHVLGKNPPKGAELTEKGQAFIRTPEIPHPVMGRTVNVLPSQIERVVIGTNHLRVDFDARAYEVAAKLRPWHLMSREIDDSMMSVPGLREVVRDMERGEIMTNRWARYERYLAAMRGETVADEELPSAAEQPKAVTAGGYDGALGALVAATGTATVTPAPVPVEPAVKRSVRDEILDVLREGPATSGEVGRRLNARRAGCARTYRLGVLAALRGEKLIVQDGDNGPYRLPA